MEIAALSNTLGTHLEALPTAPRLDLLATERFDAVMNAPDTQPTEGVQAALQSAFEPPLESTPTLGGQILSGLQGVAGDLSTTWQSFSTGVQNLATGQPTFADMLRFQYQAQQLFFQSELVAKVVSKTAQNTDSLIRMS